ncbi:MAG: hypothetical protein J0L81_17445 [Caulobacterales bacterium]|nr:hypothetical protein [Caulobacterales bacterium]
MRNLIVAAGLVLAACASPAPVTTRTLVSTDAATQLAVGNRITEERSSRQAREGMDPLVTLALRHADGRRLSFQEANHTPHDLMAQRAGGALAQIMGLPGEEATTLYHAVGGQDGSEGAFFCGPQGPAAIGAYQAPDGTLLVVGLRQAIQFETRPDGVLEAPPYSPDQVCARLRFRQG